MKRIFIGLFIFLLLTVAYFTKPDNKTCIIQAVKAVWGNKVPNMNTQPIYFEQFMDVTSEAVEIDDWWFVKRIRYQVNDTKKITVGYGAFKRVFFTY